MKLEVHERLVLLGLLESKKEGEYEALKTFRRAREMIAFSPDELKFYNLRNEPGADGKMRAAWDMAKAREQIKDCPIEEYIHDWIRKTLMDMEKKGKLTEDHMSIFEKFVLAYQA